ncbi:hypothetical protein [Gordonia alkanivorans]|uniref:hypothetical protein n=1 Tax=Gordonia alkanivorans TaxID=84096 RepID=UPI0004B8B418|nr:hypothetical protein [Gordonia alkanivorans]
MTVQLSATDFHDPERVVCWSRASREDTTDPGQWSGDSEWAIQALLLLDSRTEVVVLRPNVIYIPSPDAEGTTVEAVAAALIGAVSGRAEVTDLLAELPEALFVDDDEPTTGPIIY